LKVDRTLLERKSEDIEMRKLAVLLVLAVAFSAVASAAPIYCGTVANTMTALIATNATGGCFVQDKLFTNFSYSTVEGGTGSNFVGFNVIYTPLPTIDIHGFSFAPVDGVWTKGFTLGYTISVIPGNAMAIVGAADQMMLGPDSSNTSTAVSTKSNGPIFNMSFPAQTVSAMFAGVSSIDSMTVVTIPGGINDFVVSIEEDYTQRAIPEPMTFVLIGTGLVALGLIRRKARKS
jgi:hypothetical protein